MAPLNLNAQRTAALGIPGFDHGEYFADPNETRGIRNNNPGNIEMVSRDPNRSAMHSEFGRLGSDGRFAVYATPMGGIAANFEVLNDMQSRRGLNTLAEIVSAWAPPNENNTKAYIAAVSKATGIGPNDRLPSFFSRPDVAASILSAKYAVENGINPYDKSTVLAGVELARDAMSRNFSKMDSISERGAMARNMEEQRQSFRGPTDYGAPVWDGTYDQTPTLAAPIGAVSFGGDLPDAQPFGTVPGSLASAYDTSYTPGPDLGANLSSAVPSSDFTPNVSPYGFSGMSYSPGMGQVQDRLSQTYAGTVPGGGVFAPDTSYAPGPDLGFNLSSSVPSDVAAPDAGWGRTADKDTTAAPVARDMSPYGFSGIDAGSMAAPVSMGMGITPNGVPDISPTSFSATNMISPGMTGAFGLTGIAGMAPSSPSSQTWGLDGITEAPAKPNTAAATAQPELPGFQLPPDAPVPTLTPTVTNAAPSRQSAQPASRTAAPAPAIERPQTVQSYSVKEASPAPSQTYADTLKGFGSPDSFVGSLMSGNRSGVEALSGLTGTNWGGLAQVAMSGDQYAQPAMLGLMNAYANATGTTAPIGLFGGWGNAAQNDGLGAVVDPATGKTLGMADPSDPERNNGLFGGLFGGWGWGGGGGDGLGTTPGSGGLY